MEKTTNAKIIRKTVIIISLLIISLFCSLLLIDLYSQQLLIEYKGILTFLEDNNIVAENTLLTDTTYTLTFKENEDEMFETISVIENNYGTKPVNEPVLLDYEFEYWYDELDTTKTEFDFNLTRINKDYNFLPIWKVKNYSVNYNFNYENIVVNGDDFLFVNIESVGTKLELPTIYNLTGNLPENYLLIGWSINSTPNESNLIGASGLDITIESFRNINLYAYWVKNLTTISAWQLSTEAYSSFPNESTLNTTLKFIIFDTNPQYTLVLYKYDGINYKKTSYSYTINEETININIKDFFKVGQYNYAYRIYKNAESIKSSLVEADFKTELEGKLTISVSPTIINFPINQSMIHEFTWDVLLWGTGERNLTLADFNLTNNDNYAINIGNINTCGSYTFVISLNYPQEYQWEDLSSTSKNVSVKINKQTLNPLEYALNENIFEYKQNYVPSFYLVPNTEIETKNSELQQYIVYMDLQQNTFSSIGDFASKATFKKPNYLCWLVNESEISYYNYYYSITPILMEYPETIFGINKTETDYVTLDVASEFKIDLEEFKTATTTIFNNKLHIYLNEHYTEKISININVSDYGYVDITPNENYGWKHAEKQDWTKKLYYKFITESVFIDLPLFENLPSESFIYNGVAQKPNDILYTDFYYGKFYEETKVGTYNLYLTLNFPDYSEWKDIVTTENPQNKNQNYLNSAKQYVVKNYWRITPIENNVFCSIVCDEENKAVVDIAGFPILNIDNLLSTDKVYYSTNNGLQYFLAELTHENGYYFLNNLDLSTSNNSQLKNISIKIFRDENTEVKEFFIGAFVLTDINQQNNSLGLSLIIVLIVILIIAGVGMFFIIKYKNKIFKGKIKFKKTPLEKIDK